jgi:hypothetical protein
MVVVEEVMVEEKDDSSAQSRCNPIGIKAR